MDKSEVLEKVNRFSEAVIAKYDPLMIILFGSYANGQPNENSDIDIAVVIDKLEEGFINKEADLFKIRRSIDYSIEPVLLGIENDKSGFLEDVLKRGKIVYEKI